MKLQITPPSLFVILSEAKNLIPSFEGSHLEIVSASPSQRLRRLYNHF